MSGSALETMPYAFTHHIHALQLFQRSATGFASTSPLLSTDLQDILGLGFGSGAGHIFYGKQNILQILQRLPCCTKNCGCCSTRPNRWVHLIPSNLLQAEQDVLQSKLGSKFGTKLGNAADNLYTFVSHPGMHPTNNESERMLGKVVIHHKIRQRLVTNGGMRTFEICMLTWDKRNLDLSRNLLEVLQAT